MFGDHVADGRGAFSAIERTAMVRLDGVGAAGARFDGLTDGRAVDTIANANDHENDLQNLRMIVKCMPR